MEKFLDLGTPFSKEETSSPLLSERDALRVLETLIYQAPLSLIIPALGDRGDPHLVGGMIRDVFVGLTPEDFDLATSLPPQEVKTILEAAGVRVVETGLKHGTVTAVIDGAHVEITTFRVPGPHGENKFSSSIEEDLGGRDFTFNAIAYSVKEKKIVDPLNGMNDLALHLIRAVGDPAARFSEDPLRILRMIRFGPAEGRGVEEATLKEAERLRELLGKVSAERLQHELKRIVAAPHPRKAFTLMRDIKLLEVILPEMLPSIGCEQNEFHTEDVFEHTLSVMERCPAEGLLRWSALFHDLGKPATLTVDDAGRRHFYEHEVVSTTLANQALSRLKFSHDETKEITTLVRHHMRPIDVGPSGLRRIIRDTGEYFAKWRQFKVADAPPIMAEEEVQDRMNEFDLMVEAERKRVEKQGSKLAVNGEDLKALGFKEGKELGSTLKALEEAVIEDPTQNERELLLNRAKALLK